MLTVKLRSFFLKDIKAFKQRKRKLKYCLRRRKMKKVDVETHLSPIKFIDPFCYHRIISDIIIIEETSKIEEQYFSALKIVSSLKHIITIDFYEEFTYVKFQNSTNYPYTPIDLVLHRLRSLGNLQTFKLAEKIAEYKELCLLIKTTKYYGYKKEILDCFSPKYLKFLKDYFAAMVSSTMTVDQMKSYMNGIIDSNKKNPVFFLMYVEYKEYIGTQLIGLGVNKIMRRLIDMKDFDIFQKEIWCVEGKYYFDYLHKLLNEMLYFKENLYQSLFINTKFGFLKVKFEVKTFFVAMKNEKKVFVSCVAIEKKFVNDIPIKVLDALYDEDEPKDELLDTEKCEKNKIWNKLIDCYFDFSNIH